MDVSTRSMWIMEKDELASTYTSNLYGRAQTMEDNVN
jgi:hypothetical protein